ncbi:MAG TPA: chemotaxis protein CheX [Steroidobacteraceae bacterium]
MASNGTIELRRSDLCEIVDAVVTTMLRSSAVPMPEGTSSATLPASDIWSGHIKISGAFSGVIVLTCTRQFAHHAARALFNESSPKDEDATDALAELTNVTGGNVKCLMSNMVSSTCQLALPQVTRGTFTVPGGRKLRELWATCEGHKLGISVLAA